MNLIYQLSLLFYSLVARVISPFNLKAQQWVDGRKGLFERLELFFKDNTKPVAWFHAASLGEFEQGRPVIELFRERYPDYLILLTFFSPSGYEMRKDYDGVDYVCYLPIDTKRNARRFVSIVNPKVVVFVKYEFWKNILRELSIKGVKTYVVSAIFRSNQLFFKPYGGAYAKVLSYFTHIFVQNEQSRELLSSIGIDNVTVCGDTRFDRVYSIAKSADSIPLFEKFAKGSQVFISGSSWESDDKITVELIREFKTLKFIIAPHEIGEQKIVKLQESIESLGRKVIRYTKIEDETVASLCDVIIIDTIGILSKVYRNANFGYIGGGFGVGIHNTLEAATFNLPIIFGPNYKRFAEAVTLVDIGVATAIESGEDAEIWLRSLLEDSEKRADIAQKSHRFIDSNIGACQKIIDHPLL